MDADNANDVSQSSSATSKRFKRTTSSVWKDFIKQPADSEGRTRATCKFCNHDYVADAGTSSLKRHANNCAKRDLNEHPIYEFDQGTYRKKVARSIIRHNYPYSSVEHEGSRDVHRFLNPSVTFISRNTAKADVIKVYEREKKLLRPLKKILNFHHLPPPHSGPILGERVVHLLKEWGTEKKIFSITLDNARYNDGLVDKLKGQFKLSDSLVCGGDFFHVRCSAHILNLIVQSGLKVIEVAVHNIRESVKYVKGSEARKLKFAECIAEFSGNHRKVRQDVPTRWNSTYLMLENVLSHRLAFAQLTIVDPSFKTFPTVQEWERVENLTNFLKPFYEITILFSGSRYPTSNLYFNGVWKIQLLIKEMLTSEDEVIRSMAQSMEKKFEKYWESYSTILSMAVVLDPRYKIQFVEFRLKKLDEESYLDKVSALREKMDDLFEEYAHLVPSSSSISSSQAHDGSAADDRVDETEEFELFETQQYGRRGYKSALTLYLEEPRINIKENSDLDILNFWKMNKMRYPNLAMMARDVLSIPITTVASESTFSIGAQIIEKIRSSITPSNAESLLCSRDWLYGVPDCEDLDVEYGLVKDFECLVNGLPTNTIR